METDLAGEDAVVGCAAALQAPLAQLQAQEAAPQHQHLRPHPRPCSKVFRLPGHCTRGRSALVGRPAAAWFWMHGSKHTVTLSLKQMA